MDDSRHSPLLADVAAYYSACLAEHGQTARGVDWNGEDSQQLRFAQLTKIVAPDADAFSLNDVGCGYGALVDFLVVHAAGRRPAYAGNDISSDMVAAARQRHRDNANVSFHLGDTPRAVADFGIASGLFNVHRGHDGDAWLAHIHATLDMLHETSRLGFSFNCLTSYSDPPYMRPERLYYADPCALFDHCKRRYSRQVALLHDYGLYEFTMLVRTST
ncbi:SAM-dependent methyltransferase [Burkholderia pyrrocinia]|uniref:SAM-dependent methyltransferase n=1 Tax=Burkholderia pyrrocinia TaxID=60550 RepID=A0A2Z5MPR1_BURPY|nr:class I SAM-dependent methyltransferase [Burkholderia pyrrocinia]AXF19210.1 SAM-dependent methyltransferase [Burkholderia pyrrocinia]